MAASKGKKDKMLVVQTDILTGCNQETKKVDTKSDYLNGVKVTT